MTKLFYQSKIKVNLFLLSFENINISSKGNYRLKIQCSVNEDRCLIRGVNCPSRLSEIGQKQNKMHLTKQFKVKYQNQKIELNDLISIETPIFKCSKDSKLIIKLTLLRAQKCHCEDPFLEYVPLRNSYGILRFPFNNSSQYVQCPFQEPFSSNLSLLLLIQPAYVKIKAKEGKVEETYGISDVRKDVKKLRYQNYILYNKFKKMFYGKQNLTVSFSLPKLFVSGQNNMTQQLAQQQNFLSYLVNYEDQDLSVEQMNKELQSICQKNEQLFEIFKSNCLKQTLYLNKIKCEYQEKITKRYKMNIAREEYKERYYQQYKNILKDKLKILNKERQIGWQDQTLNNIVFKMDNIFQKIQPSELPHYPVILHQTQRLKQPQIQTEQQKQQTKKIKQILILAHGYQGSPDDLLMFANGYKKKYKKTKYLILRSYQDHMSDCIAAMADFAVKQVNCYLDQFQFKKDRNYRIVMIGHSMGGIILRIVANKIKEKYQQLLYGFVSLGTSHLGYLQGLKLHIRAGLSLFSSMHHNQCLTQLSGKDSQQFHDSAIYNCSQKGTLHNFKKIVLVSCSKDKYVSWHSSRIQNFNKDILKEKTYNENQMVKNIIGKEQNIERIDRLQVNFKLTEGGVDKLIGRTCHIKLLTDLHFIQLMCQNCLPSIFDN